MHVKRITSLASLALLGALALPPSGLAQDAAKEGTAKYTTYWVASSYSPIKLDTDGFAIFDFSGVTSSDNPLQSTPPPAPTLSSRCAPGPPHGNRP